MDETKSGLGLAQRCSINVGSFVLSFIHAFSHTYNLSFGGDSHVVSSVLPKDFGL